MLKNAIAGIAGFVMGAVASATPASANSHIFYEHYVGYGTWTAVGVESTQSGDACGMVTSFTDDSSLSVLIWDDGNLTVNLFDPMWEIRQGAETSAIVRIDGRAWRGEGFATGPSDIVVYPEGDYTDFIRRLRQGWEFEVEFPSGEYFGANLRGSDDTMDYVNECIDRYLLDNGSPTRPRGKYSPI